MSLMIFKIGGVLCGLIALLFIIRKLGARYDWHPEWQRKALHIALGATALTFPWLFDQAWQVAILCALGLLIMIGLRKVPALRQGVGRCLHDVKRNSHGEIFFALSIVGLFGLAQAERLLYLLPLAILTFADAAAALVGNQWGKHSFAVMTDNKSWEGVVAFTVVALSASMLLLPWMTTLPWLVICLIALTLAIFSALVEAASWHGLDNLLIPLGSYWWLTVLLPQSDEFLLGQLLFLGGLIGVAAMQPWRCTPHPLLLGLLALYCVLLGGNLLWLVALLWFLLMRFVLTRLWEEWENNNLTPMPNSFWLLTAPMG